RYSTEVRRMLPALVRAEGPIHVEHALKRINASLRLKRSTAPFKEIFGGAVRDLARRGVLSVRGGFLWPEPPVELKVRVPVEGVKETFRPIEYIPPEEVRMAVTLIAGHSLGLRVESLLSETARLLGFRRMGKRVRAALAEAYESLIREGVLVQREDRATLADGSPVRR
ncbi:MAG: hypothetical protein ACE5OO_02950, partial [Candidatus Bathyarchaeia archaeon]